MQRKVQKYKPYIFYLSFQSYTTAIKSGDEDSTTAEQQEHL